MERKNRPLYAISVILAAMLIMVVATSCEQHVHTKADEWSFDETHHWHAATCEHTSEKLDYGEHVWNEFKYNAVDETEESVCRDCKYVRVAPHVHTYGKWEYDTEEHWVRTTCRWHAVSTMKRGLHDWSEPTYEEWDNGTVEVRVCKVCDIRSTIPLDKKEEQ